MRKLIVLLVTAGFLLGFTGSAQAGVLDEANSTLGLTIGGLPEVNTGALPGSASFVTLSDIAAGHNILVLGTVWSTVNFGPGTSLFTGVPLISNLKVTMSANAGQLNDGAFPGTPTVPTCVTNNIGGGGCIGPTFGGFFPLNGQAIIHAAGGALMVPVPLSVAGGFMGETTMVTLLGLNITVTGGPFISGQWQITGISTNVITIPARGNIQGVPFTLGPTTMETVMTPSTNGGFVSISGGNAFENHTVTISGTNNLISADLTPSQTGTVTVVSPLRIATGGIAGNIPGSSTIHMEFVPEPGTVLLLVSGAVGLAVIGRRRMRK